ncbi:MAG: glycosyltransferase family 1 protein [Patescibacteria group bacterium]
MRIAIDGNEANVENRVGVNQYAAELLTALENLQESKKHEWIIFLDKEPLQHLPQPSPNWKYIVGRGGLLGKLTNLWFANPKLDVYFAPTHYLPPISPVPMVMSIMDLGYLRFPNQFTKRDFYQLKYWTNLSLRVAKKVIAISESTRDEIISHYPWTIGKVEVTLLGYNKTRYRYPIQGWRIRRTKEKYGIFWEYVIYVGTLKPSKNVEGLLDAFRQFKNADLSLVIVGKKGWLYESIFEKAHKIGLEDKIIFTDFVSEEEKADLLSGAKCLVSPSFWEGFGMHVLEAMACGCPVVVSKVGSLPEVVGEAGILVDPGDSDSIAKGIEFVVSLPANKYNQLRGAVLKQAEKFSWDKTARETLSILKQAYDSD